MKYFSLPAQCEFVHSFFSRHMDDTLIPLKDRWIRLVADRWIRLVADRWIRLVADLSADPRLLVKLPSQLPCLCVLDVLFEGKYGGRVSQEGFRLRSTVRAQIYRHPLLHNFADSTD